MDRSFKYAAAGAGIAAAAWIAQRLARRLMGTDSPQTTPTRPAPNRPATPPANSARAAEVKERLDAATALAGRLRSPHPASSDVEIREMVEGLAGEIRAAARPNEDVIATVVRSWRQLDAESQRRWPGADVVRRAGDAAWSAVFRDPAERDVIKPAAWTQFRQTNIVTNERMGSDELLVRLAAAHCVVRPGDPASFDRVVELWRRGVVPDVTKNRVVTHRAADGAPVVGVAVHPPAAGPQAGREVA